MLALRVFDTSGVVVGPLKSNWHSQDAQKFAVVLGPARLDHSRRSCSRRGRVVLPRTERHATIVVARHKTQVDLVEDESLEKVEMLVQVLLRPYAITAHFHAIENNSVTIEYNICV